MKRIDEVAAPIVPTEFDATAARALVLQAVGGESKDQAYGPPQRGQIHLSVTAEPSVNVSEMVGRLCDIVPSSLQMNGTSASRATAIGSFQGGTFTPGPVLTADHALIAIESFNEFTDRSAFDQILNTGEYSFADSEETELYSTSASILLVQHPSHGAWDNYMGIGEQLNLPSNLVSAVDLPLIVTAQDDGLERSNLDLAEAGDVIRDARERTTQLTEEARSKIQYSTESVENNGEYDMAGVPAPGKDRISAVLYRLATAAAKLRASDVTTGLDVKAATKIVQQALEDIGHEPEPVNEKEVFDESSVESAPSESRRDRVKNIKELIDAIATEHADEPGAPISAIKQQSSDIGMTTEKVESEMEKLRTRGELYEPVEGYIRPT